MPRFPVVCCNSSPLRLRPSSGPVCRCCQSSTLRVDWRREEPRAGLSSAASLSALSDRRCSPPCGLSFDRRPAFSVPASFSTAAARPKGSDDAPVHWVDSADHGAVFHVSILCHCTYSANTTMTCRATSGRSLRLKDRRYNGCWHWFNINTSCISNTCISYL